MKSKSKQVVMYKVKENSWYSEFSFGEMIIAMPVYQNNKLIAYVGHSQKRSREVILKLEEVSLVGKVGQVLYG